MFPSFNMFRSGSYQPFSATYRCFPAILIPGNEREDVEKGGKILMPPSALRQLTEGNISYPMMFKLTNSQLDRCTHCGVLEFIAEEGRVYLPMWMMDNLMLNEGDPVDVQHTVLPVATFSRFQPHSVDFLDISNPKAVLENCLRYYACLSAGDVINLKYNDKDYQLSVLETRPKDAVSIIECDMNVDFAPPIGYVSTDQTLTPENIDECLDHTTTKGFVAFGGSGSRLDGKPKHIFDHQVESRKPYEQGMPDYNWKLGTITFNRLPYQTGLEMSKSKHDQPADPFPGIGFPLRMNLDE